MSRWNFSKRGAVTVHDDTFKGIQNPYQDNAAVRETNSGVVKIYSQFPMGAFSLSRYPGRSGKRDISVNNWADTTKEIPYGERPNVPKGKPLTNFFGNPYPVVEEAPKEEIATTTQEPEQAQAAPALKPKLFVNLTREAPIKDLGFTQSSIVV